MAGKVKTVYVCSECGHTAVKWSGQCPNCGEWNTMNEEIKVEEPKTQKHASPIVFSSTVTGINDIKTDSEIRYVTGISELDRVLGGGIVKGSLILLSGDPGIGKSTLLMQICGRLQDKKVLYVTGEESVRQLKLRADRLGVNGNNILLMSETDVLSVREQILSIKPDLVMIDSIQTMYLSELSSSSGSVAQVRECTNIILRACKSMEIPGVLVGHVNKDGAIAGPKVMEHIVDAVLYFEGDKNYSFRILRAVKNRYGSTNEIGIFEMDDFGLTEVQNPSMALISDRTYGVSGNSICCTVEGTRPILTEIQSLVSTTGFGNPRRMSTGFDYNRLNLILAVLEKRQGFYFSNLDVYLNVVGGLRLDEPATDLSVALSLVSGLKDRPIPDDTVVFGEIGLSGELRSVPRAASRINEISRLGFKRVIIPKAVYSKIKGRDFGSIEIVSVRNIGEAIAAVF